ncbi:phytoene desaturase [Pseudorhodoplanes sp.]|uniref:phytoene desaturase n=1 Tax=Pseudorhodoplanes sp. TaxID=1934341 RepID=UPI00391A7793
MLDVTGFRGSLASRQDRRPHAIVIGSGFGGLAAAIRLGARGYRVTVLERLDAPGGRASVHRQDGFTFDAGPTIVTAPFLFEELWRLCGRNLSDDVELRPVSPFYRIRFHDGETFDYCGDPQAMERKVSQLAPGDVEGYRAFMALSEATYRTGFERLGHVPFGSVLDMIRILPDLLRLQCFRSVHGEVARHVQSEKLRQVLSFHPLLIGGNPFSATSVYCLIAFLERAYGVHFAMGGTGTLVTGMVRLIEGQGGRVVCNAAVRRIAVENGAAAGVELEDGDFLPSDIVVSNADSASTYRHLIDPQFRRRWTDRKIERARYSMSLFVWYFGTNRQYRDVQHHTILLGPRYRGLLTDIFQRKILADDFSLYLHRPTATDPSLAPDGCDAFYVLSPVPHLEAGIDWQVQAEPYRARIAQYLSQTLLPGLDDAIVTSRMTTPLDFENRLSSFRGAAFGLEPVLTQSAWFRPHNKSEDIANLYLVGAGTHPGAGLPGVLTSARILDTVVPDAMVFAER